ncbi:hypothetical protein M3Y97_00081700 [Aphelenchoides bicaudatus]|nr:hypothetical protein M3Y97_00081700 [Aphelenchoides bicaudatus]
MSLQEFISNVALTAVIGVAILLILMVIFLFALVVSLTFDCWWSLGKLFNIEEDDTTGLLSEDDERQKRPWLLRIQNGKIHNVRAFGCSDMEMV